MRGIGYPTGSIPSGRPIDPPSRRQGAIVNDDPELPDPLDRKTQMMVIAVLVVAMLGLVWMGLFGYVAAPSEFENVPDSSQNIVVAARP